MKFYHGGAYPKRLRKIKSISGSFEHGIGMNPDRVRDRPEYPYFYDNGAFNGNFQEDEWIQGLEKMVRSESSPDFVVLPDVFDDPGATWEKHRKYYQVVNDYGFDHYYVAQKGSKACDVVSKAMKLGCSGIFIGGSWDKKKILPNFLKVAGDEDLPVHIGMPGDLLWASRSGADSMDSTSISRNRSWGRLKDLEENLP